jgi:hypothetical protein
LWERQREADEAREKLANVLDEEGLPKIEPADTRQGEPVK